MSHEFVIAPQEAPREQQFRIFDAAMAGWKALMEALPEEEALAATATIAAMLIGQRVMAPDDERAALDYLRKTAETLLPETRRVHAAAAAAGAH